MSNSGPLRTRRRRRNRAAKWLGILRIDLSTLHPEGVGGPNIEISGVGPVPLSVARRLLGDAVLKLVVTRGVDVLNVTHLGRGPSAAQEIALLWSQPLCKVTGCPLPVSQVDHREPWRDQRVTCLANLDGFCDHHHDLKTYSGWALVADGDCFVMAPPDDPRHPSHAEALANAPP